MPSLAILSSMLVSTIGNFAAIALIGRYLGAGPLGRYVVIVTVVQLVSLVCALGLDTAIVYFAGKTESARGAVESAGLRVSFMVGFPVGLLGIVTAAWWFPDVSATQALIVGGGIPLTLTGRMYEGVIRSRRRVGVAATARMVQGAALSLGTAALAGAGALTQDRALLVWAVSWAASVTVLGIAAGTGVLRGTIPDGRAWMRRLVNFGLRGHGGLIAQQLTYRLDILLVAAFVGSIDAGLYGAVGRVVDLLWYVPAAMSFDFLPRLLREASHPSSAAKHSDRAAAGMAATLGLMAVVIAVLAEPALRLVFGDEFGQSASWLRVLMPGAVVLGVAKLYAQELIANGAPEVNAMISSVALVLAIGLGLAVIPTHGAAGAAWLATTLYTCQGLVTVAMARRSRTWNRRVATP